MLPASAGECLLYPLINAVGDVGTGHAYTSGKYMDWHAVLNGNLHQIRRFNISRFRTGRLTLGGRQPGDLAATCFFACVTYLLLLPKPR